MAKLNGTLYLTRKQIKTIAKGNPIDVYRDGKIITIGLKSKDDEQIRLINKIRELKAELKEKRKGGG